MEYLLLTYLWPADLPTRRPRISVQAGCKGLRWPDQPDMHEAFQEVFHPISDLLYISNAKYINHTKQHKIQSNLPTGFCDE